MTCQQVTLLLILVVVLLLSSTLLRVGAETDLAPSPTDYDFQMLAASVNYANPAYLGPATFVRVFRKSRGSPPALNGFFQILKDVPITSTVQYSVLQKLSNKWKETFFKVKVDFCRSLKSGIKLEKAFYAATNFPKECPIVQGNYTLANHVLQGKNMMAVFPYVDTRFQLLWANGDTTIMNWSFDVRAERKKVGNGKKGRH